MIACSVVGFTMTLGDYWAEDKLGLLLSIVFATVLQGACGDV
jgi:hypothetical protein